MVKLINKFTGTATWVTEERLEEYLALGHKLAEEPEAEPEEPVKKTAKKTTRKK